VIDQQNYNAADILKDGTPVTIRAIRRDDRSDLLRAFENLDPESVYTRFFTYKRGLTDTELLDLTEVDPNRVVALVAATPIAGAERLVGGGRYCCDVSLRRAEVAFITGDAFHHRGIASLILQHLVRIGRKNGVLVFVADVLAQNQAMLSVFRRVELPMKKRLEGDVVHIELSLTLD
jgi:RimJ/RimL family protein N-acetyltransferase